VGSAVMYIRYNVVPQWFETATPCPTSRYKEVDRVVNEDNSALSAVYGGERAHSEFHD
jgi:hypothetical protein